jgi:hypothetical protein
LFPTRHQWLHPQEEVAVFGMRLGAANALCDADDALTDGRRFTSHHLPRQQARQCAHLTDARKREYMADFAAYSAVNLQAGP